MKTTPIACHDHNICITQALESARVLCGERGVRLTDLREQVLSLIWQSHKPLGAYSLMDMLALASTRRVAPPTVYRALEFLLAEGFIHRINSLNAFVGCPSPNKKHQSHFLICRKCGNAVELQDSELSLKIYNLANKTGFTVESESLEVTGVCSACE